MCKHEHTLVTRDGAFNDARGDDCLATASWKNIEDVFATT